MISEMRAKTADFAVPDNRLGVLHLLLALMIWSVGVVVGVVFFPHPVAILISAVMFWTGVARLFAIQHDCGHLSYFSDHRANVWVGVLLGAFTAHPFHTMRYNHNRHHANLGNLDAMESHEVMTWTVRQWEAAKPLERLGYRLYRSPLSICLVGPVAIILIRYRFPKNAGKVGYWDPVLQNVLMAVLWGTVIYAGGIAGLSVMLTGAILSVCLATFFVYTGHNHETTYWQRSEAVDFHEASLRGASVIDLGPVVDFMIFNFSFHDLHHFNSKIPCYRLKACYRALEGDLQSTRLGLFDLIATLRCNLWDEGLGRMVGFRDVSPVFGFRETAS